MNEKTINELKHQLDNVCGEIKITNSSMDYLIGNLFELTITDIDRISDECQADYILREAYEDSRIITFMLMDYIAKLKEQVNKIDSMIVF